MTQATGRDKFDLLDVYHGRWGVRVVVTPSSRIGDNMSRSWHIALGERVFRVALSCATYCMSMSAVATSSSIPSLFSLTPVIRWRGVGCIMGTVSACSRTMMACEPYE